MNEITLSSKRGINYDDEKQERCTEDYILALPNIVYLKIIEDGKQVCQTEMADSLLTAGGGKEGPVVFQEKQLGTCRNFIFNVNKRQMEFKLLNDK